MGHDGQADARWMRRAVAVAASARGRTGPNPNVGAVVVADGHEVAVGATGPAGTAHAEPRALAAAGTAARGATLYVTLEPCAHQGRTPPCTAAIIEAGVARVVVGMRDPNPVAAGGIAALETAGVVTTDGVMAEEVAAQLAVFTTTVTTGRPHVTAKLAQTVDATTNPARLGTRWITGPVARRRVHELRADVAGVLVGSSTAIVDDPALTVRDVAPGVQDPRAVVLDRRGRLPLHLQVVRRGTIVCTSPDSPPAWRAALVDFGVDVVVVDGLQDALAALLDRDVVALLAESGPTLLTAMLGAAAVDRLLVHVASSRVDDQRPVTWAVDPTGLVPTARRRLGDDVEWEFLPTTTPAPHTAD